MPETTEEVLRDFVKAHYKIRHAVVSPKVRHDLRVLRDRARIVLGLITTHTLVEKIYGEYPHD